MSAADRRHAPDAFSLVSGLLLTLLAGAYLLDDLTDVEVDGRWVGPGLLIAVGLVGLLSTLRSTRR